MEARQGRLALSRLTPREGGILQGFPAGYKWPKLKTRAWTMIGNAVPPIMAEVLARANRP